MANIKSAIEQKAKLIFLPFVLLCLGQLIVYTFLRWYLFIRHHLFQVKADWLELWMPLILSFLLLFLFLHKRIRLLRLKKNKNRDASGLFYVAAGFGIAIPTFIAQFYIETASGTLTSLETINSINANPASKFYEIGRYYVDTANKGIKVTRYLSGRYNSTLNWDIYVSCPIYDIDHEPRKITELAHEQNQILKLNDSSISHLLHNNHVPDSSKIFMIDRNAIADIKVINSTSAMSVQENSRKDSDILLGTKRTHAKNDSVFIDSALALPKAWCCFKYSQAISNSNSTNEKNQQYHLFYTETMANFAHTPMHGFTYFERPEYDYKLINFQQAAWRSDLASDSSINNILEPKRTAYADRNGKTLQWIVGSIAIVAVVWFLLLLTCPFDSQRLKEFYLQKNT